MDRKPLVGSRVKQGQQQQIRRLILLSLLFFLLLIGCGGEVPEPTPTLSPELQLGAAVYQQHCAICHAIAPDTVVRGPSFYNVAERAATRIPGQDARAYLYNSIMRPSDFVVEGFDDVMPSTLAKELTGEQLDAVVAYLLSFDQIAEQ